MDNDDAYFEYLAMREAALNAAVGYLMVANVPAPLIKEIEATTTDPLMSLAARVALYHKQV